MQQKYLSTGILILCILFLGSSLTASADKVSELETRMLELERQNAELQRQIQSLLGEVRQQKEVVEEVAARKPAEKAPMSDFLANTKVGGDWRLRGVMMDNMWNMDTAPYNDSWAWYRMRTRLYLDTKPLDDVRFFFRLANEYKWGIDSKARALELDPDFDPLIGNKELFLDNAYLEWTSPLGIEPLTLKIGRQDLIYGEGFLILDGQDNVGSMAIAFDGIKTSWALGDQTNLDIFAMKIEEQQRNLADDEDLYGAYLTDTSLIENVKLETYILHRNRNKAEEYALPGRTGVADATYAFINPRQHTTAIGGRVSGSLLDKNLTYAMEAAFQFGKIEDPMGAAFPLRVHGKNSIDRRAFGGYAWGKYTFNDIDWKPYLKLGGVYTSGNKPNSSKYEGFDTFYAEWPKYSEGLIYQLYDPFYPLKGGSASGYGTDRDLGAWTNMIIAQVEAGFKPIERSNMSLSYQHLWADQKTGLGDGRNRGDLLIAMLTYDFNKHISSHLLGEYFWPDDYYPRDADNAFFGRWELMLKF